MRTFLAALTLTTVSALAPPRPAPLGALPNYGAWRKVTPRPLTLPTPSDFLCIGPQTPAQFVESSQHNPHRRSKYVVDRAGRYVADKAGRPVVKEKKFLVYVNAVGERAMTTQIRPVFPVGTIIVKEKIVPGSKWPELRTVMLKRERDYDVPNGDWEYLVYGAGKTPRLQVRGRLASCAGCHAQKSKSDFVFRTYLPRETRQSLR